MTGILLLDSANVSDGLLVSESAGLISPVYQSFQARAVPARAFKIYLAALLEYASLQSGRSVLTWPALYYYSNH